MAAPLPLLPLNLGDLVLCRVYFVDANGVVDATRFKKRPVLILSPHVAVATDVSGFALSTQYNPESFHKRHFYYEVQEWQEAGLIKPSYIDLTKPYNLAWVSLLHKVGALTPLDRSLLYEKMKELGYF